MITLKAVIIAMVISSSAIPVNNGNINKPVEFQRVYDVSSHNTINEQYEYVAPAIENNVADIGDTQPVKNVINEGKTYEQCMREAFERLYEEVNRMLDNVVDHCNEQF